MKKLCEDMAMAMYRQGRHDAEIARAIGYTRVSVTNWRKARGLPPNARRGRPPKKSPEEINDPLPPEALLRMEGEPVFLSGEGLDRWDIFCGTSTDGLACFLRGALPMETIGRTWTPYRRRPEFSADEKQEENT